MESETPEWTVVMNRLERLEKQNRRFKQIGALALILAGSVLLMGQAPPRRTVEANEFILKDTNGKVRLALSLGPDGNSPAVRLFDSVEELQGFLGILAEQPSLVLGDRMLLRVSKNEQELSFWEKEPFRGTKFMELRHDRQGTFLFLADKEGFTTTIGSTDLVTSRTGEIHKTSAASVVLFDKDKKVLWKAP